MSTLCPNSCRQTARIGGATAPPAPPVPYAYGVTYPKRFYAEVIVTVFKTSQLCAVVRCCAQVLEEHCTEFRTSFISN